VNREAGIVGGILGVLVGFAVVIASQLSMSPPTTSTPTPVVSPTASQVSEPSEPTDTPTGPEDPDGEEPSDNASDSSEDSWSPVAKDFAIGYALGAGSDPDQWRAQLAPYVTQAVAAQLADVDPDDIPPGEFVDYDVLDLDVDQVRVRVHYNEGWTLTLQLTTYGEHWLISDYEPN
jgi:hypothetical protein